MAKKKRTAVPRGILKEVMMRCRGYCEKCGKSLNGLRAITHHIDEDPTNHDKNNIKVVCPDCHDKYHSGKQTNETMFNPLSFDLNLPAFKESKVELPKVPNMDYIFGKPKRGRKPKNPFW